MDESKDQTSRALTELVGFLETMPELTNQDAAAIAPHIPVSFFEAGTYLQQEGAIPQHCYFVLKGLVREYQLIDGLEKTTAFYSEQNSAISSMHYMKQTPAKGYLICSEDCLLLLGDAENEAANFARFPILEKIVARMVEENLYATKEDLEHHILSSPKERYLHLLEQQPTLLQRVPQHQIASFLGITPESLSRIRKRLAMER